MSTRNPALPFGVQRSIQKEKPRLGDGVRSTLANLAMKVGRAFSVVSDTHRAIPTSRCVSMSSGRHVCSANADEDDEDHVVLPSQPASDLCRVLQGDAEAVWHFQEIFPHLRLLEQCPSINSFDPSSLTAGQVEERWHMVDWIMRYHDNFELSHLTLHLAVQILDRSLAVRWVSPEGSRKLSATALLLASKFQDEMYPDHLGLAQVADGHFVAGELPLAELEMLMQIDQRFHFPTVAHHLFWFLKLCDDGVSEGHEQYKLALYLADLGLYSASCSFWKPTEYAAAVVFLSNLLLSKRSWPRAFEKVALGGEEGRRVTVQSIVAELLMVLAKSQPGHAGYDKHELDVQIASAAIKFAERSMGSDWRPISKN